MTKHGHTIGRVQSKEYRSYHAMLARCFNPKNKEYARYGGAGISVTQDWIGPNGFPAFLRDMGPVPSPSHSLDRLNGTEAYGPGNCRWATPKEQVRNRRITKMYEGVPLAEWASRFGLHYETLMSRWRVGDRGERLFRAATSVGYRSWRRPEEMETGTTERRT